MIPITLITDFGSKDYYVGAVKGVILQLAPDARIIDISHEIQPQNVLHGAFVLRHIIEWFPPGSVHIAVVDPGVGGRRKMLAARYGGRTVIAPDNGLVTYCQRELALEEVVFVQNTQYFLNRVSHTFHGRDVIAPVAAHVANGVPLSQLGPPAEQLELLQLANPEAQKDGGIEGRVVYVDHFGTLVTSISANHLAELYRRKLDVHVYVDEVEVGTVMQTYSDVAVGKPVALIGSADMLEVSVNCGRADAYFEVTPATRIVLK